MSDRPRIRDVANLAGTSVSTVSHLLNGRPNRMSAETVARIRDAIEQLDYRPSWAARQLKTGFVPVLALLVPSVANPSHGAIACAVEETALKGGFQVLLGNSERDPVRERAFAESVWGFGVRGLIVASSTLEMAHFADLVGRGLNVVTIDRSHGDDPAAAAIDSIAMDSHRAAYVATRHLIDLGHRRIGYISGTRLTVSRRDRLAGYRAAMAEAGLAPLVSREMLAPPGFDDVHAAEHGRVAARELLAVEAPPTALVTLNDMHALGASAAARELGFRLPDDLSVVGMDDIVLASLVDPPLTTIRQPVAALAATAVERLIARIRGDTDGAPLHLSFAPELVVRRSTTRPRIVS